MFTIINKKTKMPLRMDITLESRGQGYSERVGIEYMLEDEGKYNQDQIFFMTSDAQTAQSVIDKKTDGLSANKPKIFQGYTDGEPNEYEVITLASVPTTV